LKEEDRSVSRDEKDPGIEEYQAPRHRHRKQTRDKAQHCQRKENLKLLSIATETTGRCTVLDAPNWIETPLVKLMGLPS
jgi:hypothetical protein